jgi:hypothetical protein
MTRAKKTPKRKSRNGAKARRQSLVVSREQFPAPVEPARETAPVIIPPCCLRSR